MSAFADSNQPGEVVIEPVKPGRRLHFGAVRAMDGKLMMCIGYSQDRKSSVYMPLHQLKSLKGMYKRNDRKPMYRLLKLALRHYEA